MKKFLITILCCLIVLPAFAKAKSAMTRCTDSWKGYMFDDLLDVWGRPTSQKQMDGKYYYYWEESTSQVYGKPFMLTGGTCTCKRIVMIEEGDEISECTWEGKACPAAYIGLKKWVNPQNDPWQQEAEARQQERMNNRFYQIFYDLKFKSKDWISK